ncbi:MAG: hypothetical protein ACI9HK_003683, partial [Pirellulaceae bacterium]
MVNTEPNQIIMDSPNESYVDRRPLDRNNCEVETMARECQICGKGAQIGNSVETRGKAKYLGGVGTKITGITR